MAYDRTNIELELPPAPKFSERPEKQAEIERWYASHSTSVRRQFDLLGEQIDQLKAVVDELKNAK